MGWNAWDPLIKKVSEFNLRNLVLNFPSQNLNRSKCLFFVRNPNKQIYHLSDAFDKTQFLDTALGVTI